MVEILSQDEIDSLLNALESGDITAEELRKEEQTKKIVSMIFADQTNSSEYINTIELMYTTDARSLSTYFISTAAHSSTSIFNLCRTAHL